MNQSQSSNHLAAADVLPGSQVYLRLPRVEELSFIRALWGDPDTMAAVGGPVDLPDAKAGSWFEHMIAPGSPGNCYCLIFTQADIPVGEISFHNWDPGERSADLNVKIHAAYRGQGYGKDALRTFLDFYFDRVGGQVLNDNLALGNRPGQKLLESLGFEQDHSVPDVCRMRLNRRGYLEQSGEPTNQTQMT